MKNIAIIIICTFSLLSVACSGSRSYSATGGGTVVDVLEGSASWYGDKFHGRPTASGEIYDMNEMTAAHKKVKLGTWAIVTNLENGRSVKVKINDRGPFVGNRILDCSRACAEELGYIDKGVTNVRIELLASASSAGAPSAPGPSINAAPQSSRKFTVQVGAFGDRDKAENIKAELEEGWFGVKISETTSGGRTLYRVRVGNYRDREAAEFTREKLWNEGFEAAIVPAD
jgi:peptidoglycan lytic transglycosylase